MSLKPEPNDPAVWPGSSTMVAAASRPASARPADRVLSSPGRHCRWRLSWPASVAAAGATRFFFS